MLAGPLFPTTSDQISRSVEPFLSPPISSIESWILDGGGGVHLLIAAEGGAAGGDGVGVRGYCRRASRREDEHGTDPKHGDKTSLPVHLGFVGESGKQQMEAEGGGFAATPLPERGQKRPPSPRLLGDDEEPTMDEREGDWSASDSEEDEDCENKGECRPFTVDDIPRASCDHEKQSDILFRNSDVEVRGPLVIRLFPAFKFGNHVFASDYNLGDKSEISVNNVGDCLTECHCWPMNLLQLIDIRIAGYQHTYPGEAKIYGFVAVRETTNPLRNYVYRREIENCEVVSVKRKTGVARLSLTSPARVISMTTRALIEFELHALKEDDTNDEHGLIIEGCTELDNIFSTKSFIGHRRLYGERCALDFKFAVLINAVEARVNVKVLYMPPNGIHLKLCAKTSGLSNVIRLFQGTASELGFLTSFVVAVEIHSYLELYIEGSERDDSVLGQKPVLYEWRQRFDSCFHGTKELEVKLGEFAAVSVKITWTSYIKTS
ncbi:unnamed protein product [Urochloa humidicola]